MSPWEGFGKERPGIELPQASDAKRLLREAAEVRVSAHVRARRECPFDELRAERRGGCAWVGVADTVTARGLGSPRRARDLLLESARQALSWTLGVI